jgi:hypothetical protein
MRSVFFTFLLFFFASGLYAEPLSENQRQQAQRLFSALGCRACHDFARSGSNLAGPLGRIGLKLNAESILERLQLPPEKLTEGDKFMPSYQSTPLEQLQILSRFLANRK